MAWRNRSRLRKPAACFLSHWMRELMASAVAFVRPLRMAVHDAVEVTADGAASSDNGRPVASETSRQVPPSRPAPPVSAGERRRRPMNVSLMAHARATLRLLDMSGFSPGPLRA